MESSPPLPFPFRHTLEQRARFNPQDPAERIQRGKVHPLGPVVRDRVHGDETHLGALTGQGERRALELGADVVFGAGEQRGLQRAEEAVRALRTIGEERDRADRAVGRGVAVRRTVAEAEK